MLEVSQRVCAKSVFEGCTSSMGFLKKRLAVGLPAGWLRRVVKMDWLDDDGI